MPFPEYSPSINILPLNSLYIIVIVIANAKRMKTLHHFFAALTSLLLLIPSAAPAQDSWSMELDTELKNPVMSENGHYLVYGNDDTESAECVDAKTGTKLWSRELKDFDKWEILRFVGDSVVLVGQENRYEFLRSSDGTVLKTLPIIGKDWDDLEWQKQAEEKMEPVRPYYRANIGIYYFDDGTQIVDLEKQEIIMESEDTPSKLQYKDWGNAMMILPRGGTDSIWIIDFEKREVVFRGSTDDYDLNTDLYQPFAMNENEILLFNEKNITSIDIKGGTVNSVMEVDTDDADFFFTSDLPDGSYLIASEDDVQSFYRTKDGTLLWQTPEDTIPGIVEQLIDLGKEQALLLTYHDRDATIYKVNTQNGEIAWKRLLFKQRSDLETGHKEGSKFGAMLKSLAVSMLTNMVLGPADRSGMRFNSSTGLYTYYSDPFGRSNRWERRQAMNSAYNSFLSRKKKTEAYMDIVTQNEKEVVMVVAGRAYDPANEKWRDADGEGVFTIDLNDGSLKTSAKALMLADKGGDLNAYTDLKKVQLPVAGATALLGVNDIYVEREGVLERLAFNEEKISFLGSTDSTLVFMADNDEELYHYWLLDAKTNPSTLYLLARSEDPNFVFVDTAAFAQTLQFSDYTLTGHPMAKGIPGEITLPSAVWTLTEDDMDEMEIGRLTKNQGAGDPIQGIRATPDGTFLMGEDAIAFVSLDGTCRWVHEWDPSRTEITLQPTVIAEHIVFALGDEVQVIKNDCAGTVVAVHEIDFGDSAVLTSEEGTVVILDMDEGLIYGYRLK